MSKNSKAYRAAAEKIDAGRIYSPLEAANLAKETSSKNYDATIDVAIRLGVDPRKADQLVRGTVSLPNGTGKTVRVVVFAAGENATKAEEAGADFVGSEELIEKIQGGWTDFDAAIATPDQMAKVGRVADVAKAVTEIKGGKISFRVDKAANLQAVIGKASFDAEKLAENYGALIDELMRLKPSAAKGKYLKKITVSATNGPGIPVDTSVIKDYTA